MRALVAVLTSLVAEIAARTARLEHERAVLAAALPNQFLHGFSPAICRIGVTRSRYSKLHMAPSSTASHIATASQLAIAASRMRKRLDTRPMFRAKISHG